MYKEKVSKAINSALKHITRSIEASSKTNEGKNLELGIWRSSSELEYALLLFSLTQEKTETSSWKKGINPKKEIGNMEALTEAQKHLQEAEKLVKSGKWEEAYRNTWIARNYVFRIQKNLEKKRKEKLKAEAAKKS